MIPSRTPRGRIARRVLVHLALAVALLLLVVSGFRGSPRPVIVLVSIDTLRADHLGAYGYSKPTSPFIDSLAARGVVFEQAIVPLPSTSPSHASLLTSLRPFNHGLAKNGLPMSAKVDTLAAALKRAGYYTAGAVAAEHIGRAYGFARGFDSFYQAPPTKDGPDSSDIINGQVFAAIDGYVARRKRQPLFLFVHYFDCHTPYRWWDPNDPDKAIAFTWEETRNHPKQIRKYDEGIRHVDEAVRQLHAYLEKKHLAKNMIFVVTADHGEQIGDHGVDVGHADIYRETVRVPLIMTGRGIPERRVAENVSTMDVAVTLARLAGSSMANAVDGRDLQPAIDRASALLGWLPKSAPKRAFTVIGAPGYTQSIAYIEGSRWFIKNFDYIYRDAWIATPAPAGNRPARAASVTSRNGDDVTWKLPVRSYRPFYITVEHLTKNPNCEATAVIEILPSTRYFLQPIKFRGSIRLTVPAARLDMAALTVNPAACAGQTFYSASRFGDAALPKEPPRLTDLFFYVQAMRKTSPSDELFDVESDPAMLRNLQDRQELVERDRALATRYQEIGLVDVAGQAVPSEEQQRLRSLGYLQ